jgi:hypothetical protein
MRWRLRTAFLTLLLASPAAAQSVLLVDSPFDQGGVRQPTRVYGLDPATGDLILKADLGDAYTPVLGLAAASETVLYGLGSANGVDPELNCFCCLLLRIVLDPQSTTPVSVTPVGPVLAGGALLDGFTQLVFRANGDLYGVSEHTDALYSIDLETAAAMEVGPLSVDLGGGCTATGLDVTGGDLVFDALDRLWLWNNSTGSKGLWEVNPANACALQRSNCPNSRSMSGLALADHTSPSPTFVAPSAQDDRVYDAFSGLCPVNGESGSQLMRLNGVVFDHTRGDVDSPYCASDLACDDADACTADHCSPGGCVHDSVSCDDGDACTDDACDPVLGCQHEPHSCDDGDACTTDTCNPAGGCVYTPIVCDDGDACTDDACDPVQGCQHEPHSCDDGDACTTDTCNPAGGCVYTPIVCDDGDACTTDTCNPAGGCVYTPIVCDDGDACTDDACDPVQGCQHEPHSCDDGDACTTDTCNPAGGCVYTPIVCDDGDMCTDDACDPMAGCTFDPHSGACDDGNACTQADACVDGVCSGTPVAVPEVPDVHVDRLPEGGTRLTWAEPGPGLTYALVSGPISELGGPGAIPTASCLQSGLADPVADDERRDPDETTGVYYVVRAAGTCGIGSYGQTSEGTARAPVADCP